MKATGEVFEIVVSANFAPASGTVNELMGA